MKIVEKIRPIREAEGLSREEFANLVGISKRTIQNYEQGQRDSIASDQLEKITEHPRFEKYALWLVTGKTAPEAGQISPQIEVERNVGKA